MQTLKVSNRLYHEIWRAKTDMEIKQRRDIQMGQFVLCMLNAYDTLVEREKNI